jgi:hypothetical protein
MLSLLAIPAVMPIPTGPAPVAGSLANTISNRVGLVGRFTVSTTATATVSFDFDFGSPVTADFAAALWTNLRATDTITLTAGTTSGGVDVLAAQTFPGQASSALVTSQGSKAWLKLVSAVTARYWRLSITTPASGHPAGYVEISRFVIGQSVNFTVDYTTIQLLDDDRGLTEISEYGEDVEDIRRISFGWRLAWRYGSQAEMLASHQRLTLMGKTKPIFFCPLPTVSNAQDLAAFGKMRNPSKTSSSQYDIWELGFDVFSDAA